MLLSSLKDFPDETHWVIMTTSSTHVAGDERSRTNPDHGYPSHNITSVNYEIYHDKDAWLQVITDRERTSRKDYVAFRSTGRAKISAKIQVELGDNNV